MHTLNVKMSNVCGITFMNAVLENRTNAARQADAQVKALCQSATNEQREELLKAFLNGLNNVRMI